MTAHKHFIVVTQYDWNDATVATDLQDHEHETLIISFDRCKRDREYGEKLLATLELKRLDADTLIYPGYLDSYIAEVKRILNQDPSQLLG